MANVAAKSIANLKGWSRPDHPDWSKMLRTRNRLVSSCVRQLYQEFKEGGRRAIIRMREEHPDKFILAIIGLAPKSLDITGEIQHVHLHAAISDPSAWVTAVTEGTVLELEQAATELVEDQSDTA